MPKKGRACFLSEGETRLYGTKGFAECLELSAEGGESYMGQLEILQWSTSLQNPFMDMLVYAFTFMGNEPFYFLIIPLIYWCFSKTIGFRLAYIFICSVYINTVLKVSTAVTRPINTEGVQTLYEESAMVGSHYPHDSFPSGHAQGSTTLWGYLAYAYQNRTLWIIAIFLILAISLSRLYTGLHWPTDVLAGILIGVVMVALGIKVTGWVQRLSPKVLWLLACIVPIVLYFVFSEDTAKYCGFLLGAGISYLLENRLVKMKLAAKWGKRAVAFVLGLGGVIVVQIGLKAIFPEHDLFDALRYALIAVWGFLAAPYLFVKTGLYPLESQPDVPNNPPVQA
jgi:membrane-associated phospholipid phosphatase